MRDVLVDTEGFNQYYEELNRLKDLSLSIASIGSESYADAVGDGWHDNFAFEDTMPRYFCFCSSVRYNERK